MHDTQLANLAGWPDMCDQASVVRCFKQSRTITTDLNGTWTMMVMTFPCISDCDLIKVPFTNNKMSGVSPDAPRRTYGGVVVAVYPSDVDSFGVDVVPHDMLVIPLPGLVSSGNGRLIGQGFEVNNTTAEIYKQGTVHVFRQPQAIEEQTFVNVENFVVRDAAGTGVTAVPVAAPFSARYVVGWPKTQEQVMLLSGTRTWKAAEGCYCVTPFMSEENPIVPSEYVNPVVVDSFPNAVNSSVPYNGFSVYPSAAGSDTFLTRQTKWAPVHSAGALFTGLSKETSLTIQVNHYYEYFPSATDEALVTLAKPSATYDPVALELYSQVLSSMPVGVPASMNGFGDWFAGAVSKIATPLGAMLTPFLGPGAMALGNGAKMLADSYLSAQTPQSRPNVAPRRLQAPPTRQA